MTRMPPVGFRSAHIAVELLAKIAHAPHVAALLNISTIPHANDLM